MTHPFPRLPLPLPLPLPLSLPLRAVPTVVLVLLLAGLGTLPGTEARATDKSPWLQSLGQARGAQGEGGWFARRGAQGEGGWFARRGAQGEGGWFAKGGTFGWSDEDGREEEPDAFDDEGFPPDLAEGLALLDEEELDYFGSFVAGNMIFTLLHEFGHAMISEFDLPVLGREEDAVDALAALLLIPEEDDPELEAMVVAAIDGFFFDAEAIEEEGYEPAFWGEHGLDEQRAYAVLCLLYGSNPDGYQSLADDYELPEDRQETCIEEFDLRARFKSLRRLKRPPFVR